VGNVLAVGAGRGDHRAPPLIVWAGAGTRAEAAGADVVCAGRRCWSAVARKSSTSATSISASRSNHACSALSACSSRSGAVGTLLIGLTPNAGFVPCRSAQALITSLFWWVLVIVTLRGLAFSATGIVSRSTPSS